MSMYKLFSTDAELENKGVYIEYGDFRVLLARAGGHNKHFATVLEQLTRPYRRAMQTDTMDNDLAMSLMRKAYAASVILKWEIKEDDKWVSGIEGPDGERLSFNKENVEKALTDLPELFADIQDQASKISLFRKDGLEKDAKN